MSTSDGVVQWYREGSREGEVSGSNPAGRVQAVGFAACENHRLYKGRFVLTPGTGGWHCRL